MSAALPPFQNEPYTDFGVAANRAAMESALAKVRGELGREYPLLLAGERVTTGDLLVSRNPSRPAEIVGKHHKATRELATRAIETAHANFASYSRTKAEDRVRWLVRAAAILRERKLEFDAWLVYEAGKTWPEAEAETAEAIDFCEFYARQMLRYLPGDAPVQMPGEKDRLAYLPLGAGVVIPPWNFSLAILCGMAAASLVAGNTMVIKPSSETPIIAAKFAEVLLEAGFPPHELFAAGRQRRPGGRRSGGASEDALHLLHRFAGRRPADQRTGGQAAAGTDLDQARSRGDGRQRRHHRGRRGRSRPGGRRRVAVGVRLPGPEMLGVLARHRRRAGVRRVCSPRWQTGSRRSGSANRTIRTTTWAR